MNLIRSVVQIEKQSQTLSVEANPARTQSRLFFTYYPTSRQFTDHLQLLLCNFIALFIYTLPVKRFLRLDKNVSRDTNLDSLRYHHRNDRPLNENREFFIFFDLQCSLIAFFRSCKPPRASSRAATGQRVQFSRFRYIRMLTKLQGSLLCVTAP